MSTSEKLQENKTKDLLLQYPQKHGNVLAHVFVLSPGIADRNELTTAVAIHMTVCKHVCHMQLPLVMARCIHMTILNLHSINFVMLSINGYCTKLQFTSV